ncbi:discoidin domain-containing protein [Jiangella alba]|uniref:discoidin domain-containing protein n=1 Tax=Jiangella alba TaxID=561176 RepID=UPI00083F49F5|nr:discoidin domain-containing protein [Jiangella alba]
MAALLASAFVAGHGAATAGPPAQAAAQQDARAEPVLTIDAGSEIEAGASVDVVTTVASTRPVLDVDVSLAVPDGWTAEATSASHADKLPQRGPWADGVSDGSLATTWRVTAPEDASPGEVTLTGTVSYRFGAGRHEIENQSTLTVAGAQGQDWVVHPVTTPSTITIDGDTITMANGIVERAFTTAPNMSTTSLTNLGTGQEMLHHSGEPEAEIVLDGTAFDVGGADATGGFVYASHQIEDSTQKPYEWTPYQDDGVTLKPYAEERPWPAKGKALVVTFRPHPSLPENLQGLTVTARYEIYDGIATVMKKVSVDNSTATPVMIDDLTVDRLHLRSELAGRLYLDTDYHGYTGNASRNNDKDRTYTVTDNDDHQTYTVLYKEGPAYHIGTEEPHWGGHFDGFRSFLLLHSTDHYEAQQMEIKAMYRTLAPQITENPLFYHMLSDNPTALRDSATAGADMGFEMMIQSFGSGYNMLSTDPAYLARKKADFDAVRETGMDVGGYTLLTTGQIFNPADSTCAGTGWGTVMGLGTTGFSEYMNRVQRSMDTSGIDVVELDGPWPMFRCEETNHAYTDGGDDSVYKQWTFSNDFYRMMRERGAYINAPDLHYFNGANKNVIGYEEYGWRQPRQQQLMHGRQYIYNGTYEKAPSATWTFMPIDPYHGGNADAIFKPLRQNLFDYSWGIGQSFLAGVNPAFRGTTMDDGDADVRSVVKYWVDVYKTYRELVTADIVHLIPPRQKEGDLARGTGIDAFMHAQSDGDERALVAVFNQTDEERTQSLTVPLYYTGMTDLTQPPQPVPGSYLDTKDIPIFGPYPVLENFPKPSWAGSYPTATPTDTTIDVYREGEGEPSNLTIDSNGNAQLDVTLPPMSFTWYVVTPDGIEPAAPPAKPAALPDFEVQVTSTPFGSPDADTEPGDTSATAAFDGNVDTFYDGVDVASFVGADLGTAKPVTRVRLHPRNGHGDLMQGGFIQGSNSRDSGYIHLAKVNFAPDDGWHDITLASAGAYRYYRFIGGTTKTSLAEFELFTDQKPPTTPEPDRLQGTPYGSENAAAAFDGDPATTFSGAVDAYAGLDLGDGAARTLTRFRYHPDSAQPGAAAGARIQGSNSPDSGFVDLYTIPGSPAVGWHEAVLEPGTAYRYFRYVGGTGETRIGELELFDSADGLVRASGTPFGTADWNSAPGDTSFRAAFDGKANTFFDGMPVPGYAGLDLGAGNERALLGIRYHPRSSFPERMTGARIQGSNTSPDAGWEDVYTFDSEPRVGWHTATVEGSAAYRWYRIVRTDGLLNVAELELYVAPENLAEGRPATASTTSSGGSAAAAVDGDLGSGWHSEAGDEQWLTVDLESAVTFETVRVVWGEHWARSYQVQTSDNGTDWTTQRLVFETGQGESEETRLSTPVTARYVRILANTPGQPGTGYEIRELRVLD